MSRAIAGPLRGPARGAGDDAGHVRLDRPRGLLEGRKTRGHLCAETRGAFRAERFVLFSSRDSVGGGPYVVEAAYPLR